MYMYIARTKIYVKNHLYDSYNLYLFTQIISRFFSTPATISVCKTLNQFYSSFDYFFLNHILLNQKLKNQYLVNIKLLVYNIFIAARFLNLTPLLSFIKNNILKLNIFQHKNFFTFLFFFMKIKFEPYFKHFKVFGVFIHIKGKISVTGDSRKRRLFVNLGKSSKFNLARSVVSKKTTLITSSGVLGLQM